jgi:hypothetical protein
VAGAAEGAAMTADENMEDRRTSVIRIVNARRFLVLLIGLPSGIAHRINGIGFFFKDSAFSTINYNLIYDSFSSRKYVNVQPGT